ncbi:hypothetical protein GOP47_0025876 [Adiantum capillus-veneris]|uniref:Uncharacterized protein n=1 Tax=Adiantum capillus-veneris TaxID=13818 RepID=A0A9D4Z3Y6_ADICA|nr:hypothetical protein GOP47_0025876 [Adiantum capillus-veneris]
MVSGPRCGVKAAFGHAHYMHPVVDEVVSVAGEILQSDDLHCQHGVLISHVEIDQQEVLLLILTTTAYCCVVEQCHMLAYMLYIVVVALLLRLMPLLSAMSPSP